MNELITQGVQFRIEEGFTAQWGTSGNNTHETIARQVTRILQNDKPDIYFKINESFGDPVTNRTIYALNDLVLPYTTLTDEIENDKIDLIDRPTWVGHFYGPGGTNYLAEHPFLEKVFPGNRTSPNAYLRFNNHYYDAVTHYILHGR